MTKDYKQRARKGALCAPKAETPGIGNILAREKEG